MSLKELASTMSAQGRGPDDVLVHMSSKELAGLQGLALAAGGSLTINPKTGLPEAGFLDQILPSIITFGANFMFPGLGTLGSAALGAATGALTNKQNPLMGALLGGMGGYGAGQLAGGLGAGAGATAQGIGAATAAPGMGSSAVSPELLAAANRSADPLGSLMQAADYTNAMGIQAPTGTAALQAGLQNTLNNPMGLVNTLGGPKAAMQSGLMAAAPALLATPEMPSVGDEEDGEIPKYRYSAEYTGGTMLPGSAYTGERQYFTQPTFTRMAEGGEVEDKPAAGLPAVAPDVTQGKMTGQSADAFRYLMGQMPDTRSFAPPMPAPPAAGTAINPDALTPGQKYALVSDGAGGYSYESNPANVSLSPGYSVTDGIQAGLNTPLGGALAWGASKLGMLGDMESGTMAPVTDMSSYSADSGGAGGWGGGDVSGGYGGVDSGGYDGPGAGGYYKKGGIVDLKKGGFVVPADVVSALGNGSSEAGLEMLNKRFGAKPIKGKGDGQSDSIPAKIDRKQPAAVARDEAYLNPAQVKKAGGAKKLYAMMDKIRTQAHGKKQQQRPVNPRVALA